jgi:hypothetical protein
MSGGTFESTHDLRQAERVSICIQQWRKNEMHMVGHDHCPVEVEPGAVVMKTVMQGYIAGLAWQNPTIPGRKCDEIGFSFVFNVGKVPLISR